MVQVSPSAVLRWIDQGLLQAFRTPGGHRRIRAHELLVFLKSQKLPVPRELESRQVRLVVIDDEARYLKSLGRLLAREDPRITVELFEHPVEGLIEVGRSVPDVVLLDAYMEAMDGVELCRRLKSSPVTRSISVLAMSGRPSPEMEQAFKTAGAFVFLPKPVEPVTVLEQLRVLGLTQQAASRS